MDGANKFVKGDAIAGIIITLINIIGGIIIGVMNGTSIQEAAALYTQLTVGDGLVSQLPALLISTASGILVTRAGNSENFGKTFTSQLTAFPIAMAIVSIAMLSLALIPSMPKIPFVLTAVSFGYLSFVLIKEERKKEEMAIAQVEEEHTELERKEPENVMNLISVEPMEVEIGYGLIPLADESTGGDLLQRIASVRRQCAIEMGIIVQPIRIRDNLQLKTNEYVIKIRGTVVASSELMPSMLLCMDPTGDNTKIEGIRTIEPTFNLPLFG